MSAARLEDRLAFLLAVAKVQPRVRAELDALPRPLTRARVVEWARRWNLDMPGLEWVADDVWQDRPEPAFPPPIAGYIPGHDLVLSLSWEPAATGENRAAFVARAQRELKRYVATVETWADKEGVRLARERERPDGKAETGLARWDILASRLVLGMTYEQIGAELDMTDKGARKHVLALANRLGVKVT